MFEPTIQEPIEGGGGYHSVVGRLGTVGHASADAAIDRHHQRFHVTNYSLTVCNEGTCNLR